MEAASGFEPLNKGFAHIPQKHSIDVPYIAIPNHGDVTPPEKHLTFTW